MARRPNPFLIDEDSPELTRDDFARMKPASEVLPPDLYATLVAGELKDLKRATRKARADTEAVSRKRA